MRGGAHEYLMVKKKGSEEGRPELVNQYFNKMRQDQQSQLEFDRLQKKIAAVGQEQQKEYAVKLKEALEKKHELAFELYQRRIDYKYITDLKKAEEAMKKITDIEAKVNESIVN